MHKYPPYGCGYNGGVRYSRRGPGSHRKWTSQIRLSAGQMMKSQREVRACARRAQTGAEGKIPKPSSSNLGRWLTVVARGLCCTYEWFLRVWNNSYLSQGRRSPFRPYRERLWNINLIGTLPNQPVSHIQLNGNVIRVLSKYFPQQAVPNSQRRSRSCTSASAFTEGLLHPHPTAHFQDLGDLQNPRVHLMWRTY